MNQYQTSEQEQIFHSGTGSCKISYYYAEDNESPRDEMLVNGGISDYFSMPIRTTGDISEATFAVVILSKDGILNYIAFGPIEDYQINIKEFMP